MLPPSFKPVPVPSTQQTSTVDAIRVCAPGFVAAPVDLLDGRHRRPLRGGVLRARGGVTVAGTRHWGWAQPSASGHVAVVPVHTMPPPRITSHGDGVWELDAAGWVLHAWGDRIQLWCVQPPQDASTDGASGAGPLPSQLVHMHVSLSDSWLHPADGSAPPTPSRRRLSQVDEDSRSTDVDAANDSPVADIEDDGLSEDRCCACLLVGPDRLPECGPVLLGSRHDSSSSDDEDDDRDDRGDDGEPAHDDVFGFDVRRSHSGRRLGRDGVDDRVPDNVSGRDNLFIRGAVGGWHHSGLGHGINLDTDDALVLTDPGVAGTDHRGRRRSRSRARSGSTGRGDNRHWYGLGINAGLVQGDDHAPAVQVRGYTNGKITASVLPHGGDRAMVISAGGDDVSPHAATAVTALAAMSRPNALQR